MGKELYKVSVIVPIYKVEPFIGRCAQSLMEQTLTDVEFIFVDDASPDSSISVLRKVIAKYSERNKHVKVLTHAENKGLPAARNTGLAVAHGEYIFHCDSDDFIELGMLEQLYRKAIETDADIVWCDWWLSFAKNERYMKQLDAEFPQYQLAKHKGYPTKLHYELIAQYGIQPFYRRSFLKKQGYWHE